MPKQAYFFGSFNPMHLGHWVMAQAAYYQCGLERVILVPTGQPPHRQGLWPIEQRLALARLTCQGQPHLHISQAEASSPPEGQAVHYTALTLQRLHGLTPEQPIALLVGYDAYITLPTWQQAGWLQRHTVALVAPRVGLEGIANASNKAPCNEALPGWATQWLAGPVIGVSSTWVRQQLAQGLDPRPWLHPDAWAYVQQHGFSC
jgi:nicotinate-nucleotide adenylyltransferase